MLDRCRLLTTFLALILVGVLWADVLPAAKDDVPCWPRFHGPRGDNISLETGLLKKTSTCTSTT